MGWGGGGRGPGQESSIVALGISRRAGEPRRVGVRVREQTARTELLYLYAVVHVAVLGSARYVRQQCISEANKHTCACMQGQVGRTGGAEAGWGPR